MRLASALALGLAALALGCGGERGDGRMGEACTSNEQCRRGICVAGASGDQGACTKSCASTEECPRGWSCSGVTQDNVLVCSQGAPTPFGIGARE